MAHKVWWLSHSCRFHQALPVSWHTSCIPALPENWRLICYQCKSLPHSFLQLSLYDLLFYSSFLLFSFLNNESWKVVQISSFLKNPSQRDSVSPIFMSFKWLLSKWGHTNSHQSCHKYKWLDIGCNKPLGKLYDVRLQLWYITGGAHIFPLAR